MEHYSNIASHPAVPLFFRSWDGWVRGYSNSESNLYVPVLEVPNPEGFLAVVVCQHFLERSEWNGKSLVVVCAMKQSGAIYLHPEQQHLQALL